jgi:hypothetical protein
MYETEETVPHGGIYLFERHQYESTCKPSQDEKEVEFQEGETFPGCPRCGDGGFWRYLRASDKEE